LRQIAQDKIDAATQAQEDATAAAKALADALAGVKARSTRRQTFATSVSNTSNYPAHEDAHRPDLRPWIVGYGVAGRAFTPGTGVEVAY
jgi:hypothetical protein